MDDLSGSIVKSYELRERIGQGGFGAVYRAYQPLVKRDVAVKVILPDYANDPHFIRRFEREAQLVARLEHLHIVPLYDYWRDPDGAFLVMRWLRGSSLYDSIKRNGAWALDTTSHLIDQIASALAASHRGGVVHRDIKPGNILLDEDGNAYLTDFGIAKDLTNADPAESEALVGSMAYISPEQIKKAPASPQMDIYSLGIVLFEMLTGTRPFEMGTYQQIIKKHLHELVPSVRIYRPDLPASIDDVIQRATMKDPLDRYADVLNFAADLRHCVQITTPSLHVVAAGVPLPLSDVGTISTPHEVDSGLFTAHDLPNPYKGLRPFEEVDAPDFFGRESLVERWVARLAAGERFLAIVGPSGSGKSSAVRAGFVPALRKGSVAGSDEWFMVDMTPGATPFENLVAALGRISLHASPDLIDNLRHSERGLLVASRMLAPKDGELVLLIDQFEELFTLLDDEAERRCFLDNLRVAVSDPSSRLRVIVTLRADFYHRPLHYPAFGDLMRLHTDVVLPMSPEDVERAIVAPAQRAGLTVDTDLVAAMVADAQREAGALPLLQYALMEAFERRKDRRLTLAAYRESGGVMGALSRRAEELYIWMDDAHQQVVRHLLLRLVTPGDGNDDTRRRVRLSELMSVIGDDAKLTAVLDSLVNFRLLTVDHDPETREPTVEVAHEALIAGWARLRGWLGDARGDLHMRRRLSEAAGEWRAHGCDDSFLASGARLEQFASLWTDNRLALSGYEIDFIRASAARREQLRATEQARQERERWLERRARNRLRGLVAIFAGAALVAAVLSIVAFAQSQRADAQARIAHSRELAMRSQERLANHDLESALVYALDALATHDTVEARSSLLSGLQRAPFLETIIPAHDDRIRQVAASPDGEWLVSASRDGEWRVWDSSDMLAPRLSVQSGTTLWSVAARTDEVVTGHDDGTLIRWDATTGEQIGSPIAAHSGAVYSLAFSRDGRVMASGGADGLVRLWEAETGQPIGTPLVGHDNAVWSVAFSPDGTFLASGSADGTIRLWRADDGQPVGEPIEGHTNWVLSVTFSPDGSLLASGSADNTVRLWTIDVATEEAKPHAALEGHGNWVRQIAFSAGGATLVSASADGSIRLWNVESGSALSDSLSVHQGEVWSALFMPGSERLVSGGTDGRLLVWNPSLAIPLAIPVETGTSPIAVLDYSPDGNTLLSISHDQMATLWNANTRAVMDEPFYVPGVVTGAFSPDGQWVAFGRQDGRVQLWNRETRAFKSDPPQAHEGLVLSVAYSPDGQTVASGGQDGAIHLWALAGQAGDAARMQGHSGGVQVVAYSPDGSLIASADHEGTMILWDAGSRAIRHRLDHAHDGEITSLTFSPDGRWLASTGYDETARLWDVAIGTPAGEPLAVHGDWVFDAVFDSVDGNLVTAVADGSLRLWDIKSGQPLGQPLAGHAGWVRALAMAPDGNTVVSGGADGAIVFWQIDVGAWQQRACEILFPLLSGTSAGECSIEADEFERATT